MVDAASRRVRRAFARAAASYDEAAGVQRAVIASLLDRLPPMAPVRRLIDVGCGTGAAFTGLRQIYPDAELIGVDFAPPMLMRAPTPAGVKKIAAVAAALPLPAACAELVFSSLTYQWCALDTVLREAHRVLRPDGRIAFATLASDTYRELREAFAGLDDAPHVLPMLDQAAIEQVTREAGFSELQVARETRVATFADVASLFASIRQTGASEVAPADQAAACRRRGLLGKRAWATINSRLKANADERGQLPLTYDVVYVIADKRCGDLA